MVRLSMWPGMDSYERWKSGFVSRPRMRDMTSERFSGLKTSAIRGIKAERGVSASELEVTGEAASWHGQRQTLKSGFFACPSLLGFPPSRYFAFLCCASRRRH